MKSKFRLLYVVFMIMIIAVTSIGATYAYWAATASSSENSVQTGSTINSISMGITPLYNGFSIIPMRDEDALKGLTNKCKDKYDRGACSAYIIDVYGYDKNVNYISGYMDITTNNMQNISYMVLRSSELYDENNCISIEKTSGGIDSVSENFCVVVDATPMGEGLNLSLGDRYDVSDTDSTRFILLMWLSNLNYSQNEIDIGTFNAVITMQIGSGGQVKGSIDDVIKVDIQSGISSSGDVAEDGE